MESSSSSYSSTTRSPLAAFQTPALITLLVAAIALQLWRIWESGVITSSLWLDETVTAWVVSAGPWEVIERSLSFQGQSPLFFLLVWALKKIPVSLEISFRFISLVATVGTVGLLMHALKKLYGTAAALFGFFLFLLSPLSIALCWARPYGVAILLFFIALLIAVRISQQFLSSRALWITYTTLLISLALLAPTYMILLPVMLIYWWYTGKLEERSFRMQCLLSTVSALTIVGIVGWQLHTLSNGRNLIFGGEVQFGSLISLLGPNYLASSFLAMFMFSAMLPTKTDFSLKRYSVLTQLSFFLLIVAPFVMGATSVLHILPYHVRYILWVVLAQVIVCTTLVMIATTGVYRSVLLALLVLFLSISNSDVKWAPEDWREALAVAQQVRAPDQPIYISSGLVEANNVQFLNDPKNQDYLTAPGLIYGVSNRMRPLPTSPERPSLREWLKSETEKFEPNKEIVFVMFNNIWINPNGAVTSFTELMEHWGFSPKIYYSGTLVWVVGFTRHPESSS